MRTLGQILSGPLCSIVSFAWQLYKFFRAIVQPSLAIVYSCDCALAFVHSENVLPAVLGASAAVDAAVVVVVDVVIVLVAAAAAAAGLQSLPFVICCALSLLQLLPALLLPLLLPLLLLLLLFAAAIFRAQALRTCQGCLWISQ